MQNKHKVKIDKARVKNPIGDYFLNPHFEKVASEKEKEFVKSHFEFVSIK